MTKILEKIKLFFTTTQLGHQIKSAAVTFISIFVGALALTPAWNAVFNTSLPTVQAWKDLGPVALETFYRSIGAFIVVQLGIYKYSSSAVEIKKSNIVPDKK